MLYNMVKYPQNSTSLYNELLMKCIWKKVKDFDKWHAEISYDLVLSHIYKFLKVNNITVIFIFALLIIIYFINLQFIFI